MRAVATLFLIIIDEVIKVTNWLWLGLGCVCRDVSVCMNVLSGDAMR